MGCDIHMFPQKRESWGWTFVYRYVPNQFSRKDEYPRPDRCNYFGWDDRDYNLFGVLAGVRRDPPKGPIAEPRGVPADCPPYSEVGEFLENGDYHTKTWLTLKELQAYDWGSLDIGGVGDWLARLAEIDPDPENVRIVFAFDN